MISPDQFWDQLKASGLIKVDKIDLLKAKIASKPEIANSTLKIARALVSNNLVSEDQARTLLSGGSLEVPKQPPVIETDSTKSETSVQTKRKSSRLPVILGTVVSLLGAAAAAFVMMMAPTTGEEKPVTQPAQAEVTTTVTPAEEDSPYSLTDSTDSLWARPVTGEPIALDTAPNGVQMIVRIRLAQLLAEPDGNKIIRSLGPKLEGMLRDWTQSLNIAGKQLKLLTLYLMPNGTTIPDVVAKGSLLDAKPIDAFASLGSIENETIKLATNALWCPADRESTFYYGPLNLIQQLKADESAPLRRELEYLRRETHDVDIVTMLANPNFLRNEAQGLFPGTHRRLLDGLFDFWSDEAQAVSVGFQQTEIGFLEVRMITRDDLRPRVLAARIEQYLGSLSTKVSDFLGRSQLDTHWQPIALRFPRMVSFLTEQTRVAIEGKQVAITTVLPREGTHNLLLASELGLATPLRDNAFKETEQATIESALAAKTSVRFAQKSLEEAMRDIAEQVRNEHMGLSFDIKLIGTDLQPEGITRNQQIREFEAVNSSLSDILTQIVRQANPVQNLASANDPEQKLVWVLSPDQPGTVLITTRNAANEKGIELPAPLR